MKRASIRDLHIRTSELVRQAAEGEVIVIERRGEPIAELRATVKRPGKKTFVEFLDELAALRAQTPMSSIDSTDLVSEGRDRS